MMPSKSKVAVTCWVQHMAQSQNDFHNIPPQKTEVPYTLMLLVQSIE